MNFGSLLKESAKDLGVEVSEDQVGLFSLYLENLKKWNANINLTAITDEKEIVINHFIDSISVVPLLQSTGNLLDIGSGGGFPGIPVKIMRPDLDITLLDSVNKKVSFMNDTIRKLGLENIRAVWGRAEDKQNGIPRESFDYVVTRAVSGIVETANISKPYVSESGAIVLMRGKMGSKEWTSTKQQVENKFELIEIKEFALPRSDHERTIIILKPLY